MDFVFTIYLYKYLINIHIYIYSLTKVREFLFFLGIPEMYFDKNTAPIFAPKMTKHI